jgi:shikimate kinase
MLAAHMLGNRNVFLIGPMGSGKSAVGKTLARLLGVPFHDSDREIERRTGVDIPYIFDKEGEDGFREREREALDELTLREPQVLATGGGAVLRAENRQCLAERGCVIYLQTSVNQLANRVKRGRNRPLLHNVDPREKLEQLMLDRAHLYAQIADFTVTTDGRRVKSVAEEIARIIPRNGENAQG